MIKKQYYFVPLILFAGKKEGLHHADTCPFLCNKKSQSFLSQKENSLGVLSLIYGTRQHFNKCPICLGRTFKRAGEIHLARTASKKDSTAWQAVSVICS